MEVYIDYSLILIFFIALFVLITVIAKTGPAPGSTTAHPVRVSAPQSENKLAYAFVAALFVLLVVLTIFAERKKAGLF